jgi:hypothetical protein
MEISMTKLQYVGQKKDGERAFKEKTGIEWFSGTVADVPAALAADMLKHPDVFSLADADAALSSAKPAAVIDPNLNPGIPGWAKAGIDAGMTDEQLESLAQAGGPDTDTGAKLWLDLVGKPFATEPPPPKYVMRMPDGMTRILDGMKLEALRDLSMELRVKTHPMSLEPKLMEKLVATYPVKKK